MTATWMNIASRRVFTFRMLLKVVIAVVFLVAAARASVLDNNAIATHVLDNYFNMVNASGKFCKCI